MKNKRLIITLIIILTIITFFLIMFLVKCLKNGIFGSKSNNVAYDKQFAIEEIQDIKIKQCAGDIIFKETTNDYIQVIVYGEEANDVQVNLEGGDLNIEYKDRNRFIFFDFGVVQGDIIIYIPSNYSNTIEIKNDYGECKITDLENATVSIDCDAGNVNLGKIKNANIKCDLGNIEVKEILNKCDIEADCGNIIIDRISILENSTIKADLGNIDIRNTNDIYINADVDLGKTNINKNNRNANITLNVKCDCGNVTINN